MRVLPAIINLESARKHYKNMAEGKQRIDLNFSRLGKVMVGRGNGNSSVSNTCDPLPQVQLVTPTAMAAEQARAKIKRRPASKKKRQTTTRRRRKQTGGSKKKQPIRRKVKKVQKKQKKKSPVKKVIRGRVTKKRAQSKRGKRRDNFS